MKKFMSFLVVILVITFISCSDDDNSKSENLTDVIQSNSSLSSLEAALKKVGLWDVLKGDVNYTVFAPTNQAFATFLASNGFSSLEQIPNEILTQVLLNHVLGFKAQSSQVSTGYFKTLAKGQASDVNNLSLYISVSDSGVVLNGSSGVISFDVNASNGIIHIVDSVIEMPTIVTHATSNPDFSVLVSALTRDDQPDFVSILSGTDGSPFTVFAPTNQAFAGLLTELGLSGLNDLSQEVLEKTLKYHVVAGANVLSSDLTDNMTVNTFEGSTFTITLSGGAKINDANNRESNIIVTDVQAINGVIHVIDKVILPNL